jgi:hypothetical protein
MDTVRYICISFIFRHCKDMVNVKDDGAGTMAKREHTYYLICGLLATKYWEIFVQLQLGDGDVIEKPEDLVTKMLARENRPG